MSLTSPTAASAAIGMAVDFAFPEVRQHRRERILRRVAVLGGAIATVVALIGAATLLIPTA